MFKRDRRGLELSLFARPGNALTMVDFPGARDRKTISVLEYLKSWILIKALGYIGENKK